MNEARALRDKILRVNPHVYILKSQATFAEYREVVKTVEGIDGVVAAEPFVFLELLIASAAHAPLGFALKGVDPQRVTSVLDVSADLKAGKLDDLARGEAPAIILGDALADALRVGPGDRVVVTIPPRGAEPVGQASREYPFRVTGILHTEIAEYDQRLAMTSLAAAQQIVGRGDQVMGVEAKVKDVDRSDKVAREIERALGGPPYDVKDWYELNRDLFGGHRP
jgi:lipoprotein-releasing system permease protein